ncbi:hypothetical protein P43SY_006204 [Pythium insidiosum]|uniref:Calmodulin n=1 Tax=Pythium insidiosum TaxID=114742 RepID=A0AAD5Q6K8_PYTIN|nr:hypothetical protein P43SY_006204 [Pythium insidiosum]
MASKYAKPLQIPSEFPDVLRSFTREVLRLQGKVESKEQIYEFGVRYFQELLVKRDGAGAKQVTTGGAGGSVPVYMSLTEEELRDAAFNGGASLLDFLPLAHQVALHLRANRPQRVTRVEAFAKRDLEIFVHGMLQDEMESLLREIFRRADAEEGGTLARVEFMDCLRDADLGLTRREVNLLMSEAPIDEHDPARVVYGDFVSVCFPLLRDVFVSGVIELPNDQDALTQYLQEVFASGDAEASGLLPVGELARLFRAADLGLTRLQIVILMAEAQEDKSGFVNYEKFAAHVAGMALVLSSFDSQQTFGAYLLKYRKSSEYYTLLDMNQHSFEQTLSRALEALDESHRGLLPRAEVVEAVQNAFPDISQRQMRCLMALAEPDDMGDIEYNLVVHSAFPALQKLQEYDMMIMES